MILVLSCIGVSFVDRKSLVSYLTIVTIVGITIGFSVKNPSVDLPLYLSAIITPALVSFLTLNIRLSSVESLRDSEETLQKFQDRMLTELDLAKETQSNLIALEWPQFPGIHLFSFFRAYEKVGGDAISYTIRRDGSLAIFFADVSGHGIASSMVSAMAILSFKIHAHSQKPSDCLRQIHDDLQNLVPNNHISACVLFLDPKGKKLEYSVAGHPPILGLLDSGTKFLEGRGTLIVSYLPTILSDYSLQLQKGERVLLYSDGLIEVFNRKGEIYGEENLLRSAQSHIKKSGSSFLTSLFEDSIQFSSFQIGDDISLLLIEVE